MLTPYQIIQRRRARASRNAARRQRQSIVWGAGAVLFAVVIVLPLLIGIGAAAVMVARAAAALPTPRETMPSMRAGAVFTDRGETATLHTLRDPLGDNRRWIALDTLPNYTAAALLAAEDPDFLTARPAAPDQLLMWWDAVWSGVPSANRSLAARVAQDAAGLASAVDDPFAQLAGRAASDAARVIALQNRYRPEQVIEWRLNTAYYGNDAYGIEAAAQVYYGKAAAALTLGEAAILAAVPSAPQYHPFADETAARARGAEVLRALYAAGAVELAAYDAAAAETPTFQRSAAAAPDTAPEFIAYARTQAEQILDGIGMDGARVLARDGVRIVTTLDADLQAQAECAFAASLARLQPGSPRADVTANGVPCLASSYLPALVDNDAENRAPDTAPPDDGALVMLSATTGEIRAWVGAAGSGRPPGALLQPFVYLEGFNGGSGGLVSPASMVLDIPREYPGAQDGLIYPVANADGEARGPINLREAMGAGLLPPAAEVAYRQGMSGILRTAHQLGINTLDENAYDLTLLERGGAASALDMGYAYSVFASLGRMRGLAVPPIARGYRARDPVAVLRIVAADGSTLWGYDGEAASACDQLETCVPVLEPGLAYLINDVLADQATRRPLYGENNALDLSRPGATVQSMLSDGRDGWTAGYTPDYVAVARVSRADGGALLLDRYGLNGAAAAWRAVMEYAHTRDRLPANAWARPANVITASVCDRSGLIPNGVCPVRNELFMDGTTPTVLDTFWRVVEINAQTGQLATASTSVSLRREARYFIPPAEAAAWWSENNQPTPPTEIDTMTAADAGAGSLTEPRAFDYVGGEVTIRGRVDLGEAQFYQVAIGAGLNPASWRELTGQARVAPPVELRDDGTPADSPLATWDTEDLDGLYSLRLTIVGRDNQVEEDIVQVTVDNEPPTLTLENVEAGKVYRFPGDDAIRLQARVIDNLATDHVEFFIDGASVGVDDSYPYEIAWPIEAPGRVTITAVAFDPVGNQGSERLTVEVRRAGG